MADQATILRGLMERHAQAATRTSSPAVSSGPRTLVIASGKGGVGKSHIALNTAVMLAKAGRSVCLLDTNPVSGNLELLCGLNGYWNLKHLLSGSRRVEDVALEGPCGVQVLSGAAALIDSHLRTPTNAQCHAWSQVAEYLQHFKYVVIDTASGDPLLNRRLMRAADCTWLITTPELTAIADGYSLIKACAAEGPLPQIEIVVNRADSATQARDIVDRLRKTCQDFLHQEVAQAGYIPHDVSVAQAVTLRQPFVIAAAKSPATRAIEQLTRQWKERAASHDTSFTERFAHPIRRAA